MSQRPVNNKNDSAANKQDCSQQQQNCQTANKACNTANKQDCDAINQKSDAQVAAHHNKACDQQSQRLNDPKCAKNEQCDQQSQRSKDPKCATNEHCDDQRGINAKTNASTTKASSALKNDNHQDQHHVSSSNKANQRE